MNAPKILYTSDNLGMPFQTTVHQIVGLAYSIVILGNHGEEEMVIQASGGQSRHWALTVIATCVDGGLRMPILANHGYGLSRDQLLEIVTRTAQSWTRSMVQTDIIVNAFREHWRL